VVGALPVRNAFTTNMQTAIREKTKEQATVGSGRPLDIWLSLVIVVLILTFGGGLWLSTKAVLARIDAAEVDARTRMQQLQVEVFALRKQLLDVDARVHKLAAAAESRALAAVPHKGR
jgi:hypothetical protein